MEKLNGKRSNIISQSWPILLFALNEILQRLQEKIKLMWAVSESSPAYLSNPCIQRRLKYTPGLRHQIIKRHIFVITLMCKISSLFRSQLSVLFTYLRVFSSCSSLRIVWKFLWWFIISWLCLLNAPFVSSSFVGLGEVGWSRSSFEGSFFMAKCPITIPRAKAATTKTAATIHARCPFLLNFAFSSATCIVSKVRISCLGIAFKAFKHWGNISAAYPRNLAALGLLYVNPGVTPHIPLRVWSWFGGSIFQPWGGY